MGPSAVQRSPLKAPLRLLQSRPLKTGQMSLHLHPPVPLTALQSSDTGVVSAEWMVQFSFIFTVSQAHYMQCSLKGLIFFANWVNNNVACLMLNMKLYPWATQCASYQKLRGKVQCNPYINTLEKYIIKSSHLLWNPEATKKHRNNLVVWGEILGFQCFWPLMGFNFECKTANREIRISGLKTTEHPCLYSCPSTLNSGQP